MTDPSDPTRSSRTEADALACEARTLAGEPGVLRRVRLRSTVAHGSCRRPTGRLAHAMTGDVDAARGLLELIAAIDWFRSLTVVQLATLLGRDVAGELRLLARGGLLAEAAPGGGDEAGRPVRIVQLRHGDELARFVSQARRWLPSSLPCLDGGAPHPRPGGSRLRHDLLAAHVVVHVAAHAAGQVQQVVGERAARLAASYDGWRRRELVADGGWLRDDGQQVFVELIGQVRPDRVIEKAATWFLAAERFGMAVVAVVAPGETAPWRQPSALTELLKAGYVRASDLVPQLGRARHVAQVGILGWHDWVTSEGWLSPGGRVATMLTLAGPIPLLGPDRLIVAAPGLASPDTPAGGIYTTRWPHALAVAGVSTRGQPG